MRRLLPIVALLGALLVPSACRFDPQVADGALACRPGQSCPAGLDCFRVSDTPEPRYLCCRNSLCSGVAVQRPALDAAGRDRDPIDLPSDSPEAASSPSTAGDGPLALVDAATPDGEEAGGVDVAAPCMEVCQLGSRRCSGTDIQICMATQGQTGCPDWTAPNPCGGARICKGDAFTTASCQCPPRPPSCPTGAGAFCESATSVASCSLDSDGCVVVDPGRVQCAAGKPCTGVHPFAGCSCPSPPSACRAGAGASCEGNTLVTCPLDANGCLQVATSSECPAEKPCRGTAPNAACTCPAPPPECSTGPGKVCSGGQLVTCGPDRAGCLAVVTRETCSGSRSCSSPPSGAACTCPPPPPACAPGPGKACASISELVTCAMDADLCLRASATVPCANECSGSHPTAACRPGWKVQASGTTNSLYGVSFADDATGWAVGIGGIILKTTNAGATWAPQVSGTTAGLYGVAAVSTTTAWAVGDSGTILATSNGGQAWLSQPSGVTNRLLSVSFVGPSLGWAVSDAGTVLSMGANFLWSQQPVPRRVGLVRVRFFSISTGFAVGYSGTILRTLNSGLAWTSESTDSDTFWDIASIGPSLAWIATDSGLKGSVDGGVTWQRLNVPRNPRPHPSGSFVNRLYTVAFVDGMKGWAAGRGGRMIHTTDGGQTWVDQDSRTTQELFEMSVVSDTAVWAVGEGGTIIRFSP